MTTPAQLHLAKYHGLGNDFLVLLGDLPHGVRGPHLARAACDRHVGIGADGLLRGERLAGSDGPILRFTLWNADGSEAEMSGNGMRCLVHAAAERGWVPTGTPFSVETPAGRKEVSLRQIGAGAVWASVEMGVVKVLDGSGACNVDHARAIVEVGNPHLVLLGPDPATIDIAKVGAELESSRPGGLNVEFVALGPGAGELTMRVWERGVGETMACGTGSCAAAAAVHRWGRVGPAVTVHQPGGSLAVRLEADGTAVLAGPSVKVAECQFEFGSGA